MKYLSELFDNNRLWAAGQVHRDPSFFERLCDIQSPAYLWIGCSDSRVPANEIVGLAPGELFVHRNVANIVRRDDPNAMAVIEYAVGVLRVRHIIVCGHYGCGGVRAALNGGASGVVRRWLEPIQALSRAHAPGLAAMPDDAGRWARLCEINVVSQVEGLVAAPVVQEAWSTGQALTVHGWIYSLRDGLLKDLGVSVNGPVQPEISR
jgi:carbonic anhydrase